ncbi:MAG: DUF302 domain-containing protein [Bacteroidales bacterium]|nr:DUF302 domain-containing protein [Bacteroidales bacterium]
MQYYISKHVKGDFHSIIEKVTELLKEEGFGILTEIDVKETLKKKIGVDFKNYMILGACNPHLAYRAFQAEDKIGALLPCNVTVIDQGSGNIEVAVMAPLAMMSQTGNASLTEIAGEVEESMNRILKNLK